MTARKNLINLLSQAVVLDFLDPIAHWRKNFILPVYLVDARRNSLGAPSTEFTANLEEEARIWFEHGHDGHFFESSDREAWWKYDEMFEEGIASLLGSDPSVPEAVVCNSLSVNNYMLLLDHLALARKSGKKKIITLSTFFNSDLESIKKAISVVFGDDKVEDYCVQISPDEGDIYSTSYIKKAIEKVGDLAIVFIPAICHKTGQRFQLEELSRQAHIQGAYFGVDLAHAVGNIPLKLSEWDIDFATFCSYKYLNGGPGGIGGLYVNKKNINLFKHASGWWGISSDTRFGDPEDYEIAKGARRFVSSNAPIFNMQGLRTYLELLKKEFNGDLTPLWDKHEKLSQYVHDILSAIPYVTVITPALFSDRGCQVSFRVKFKFPREVLSVLKTHKCFAEDRGDVLRVAFGSYDTYSEVEMFAKILCGYLDVKL